MFISLLSLKFSTFNIFEIAIHSKGPARKLIQSARAKLAIKTLEGSLVLSTYFSGCCLFTLWQPTLAKVFIGWCWESMVRIHVVWFEQGSRGREHWRKTSLMEQKARHNKWQQIRRVYFVNPRTTPIKLGHFPLQIMCEWRSWTTK